MDHLAARGCPARLRCTAGWLGPAQPVRPPGAWSASMGSRRGASSQPLRRFGQSARRLHLAGVGFGMARPNALSVSGWRPLFDACRGHADRVLVGLEAEIDRELTAIEREWPKICRGVIHADLFPDNVFFQGDRLTGIIDFYFACLDIIAYDLAICLNAWCFEPDGAFNITKARQMLAAYRAERPFTPRELDALPLLARGAALRFLLTACSTGRTGSKAPWSSRRIRSNTSTSCASTAACPARAPTAWTEAVSTPDRSRDAVDIYTDGACSAIPARAAGARAALARPRARPVPTRRRPTIAWS